MIGFDDWRGGLTVEMVVIKFKLGKCIILTLKAGELIIITAKLYRIFLYCDSNIASLSFPSFLYCFLNNDWLANFCSIEQ